MILYFPSHASALLFGLLCGYSPQVRRWVFCVFFPRAVMSIQILWESWEGEGEIPISPHLGAGTLVSSVGGNDITFRFLYLSGFSCTEVKLFDRVKFFCNCDRKSQVCITRILSSTYMWLWSELFLLPNVMTVTFNEHYLMGIGQSALQGVLVL